VNAFSKAAMNRLMNLRLEGNVRELENLVERAVVLATGTILEEKDIPLPETTGTEQFFGEATSDSPTIEQLERRYIELILQKTAGRKDKAAQILGINRRTLYRKEREYGLVDSNSDENVPPADGEDEALSS
jgi:DNA-binding NtrC family response regulator